MASAVYKNLEQLLKISNQVECHESGMSRSNSKKSYVDVQTLGRWPTTGGFFYTSRAYNNYIWFIDGKSSAAGENFRIL